MFLGGRKLMTNSYLHFKGFFMHWGTWRVSWQVTNRSATFSQWEKDIYDQEW